MLLMRVCSACLPEDQKQALSCVADAASNSALNSRVQIKSISCGDTCKSPARLWMQSERGAAYTFDGIDLITDQADILATAATYLDSPKGWIEDARPCGRLRFCLTARIPA